MLRREFGHGGDRAVVAPTGDDNDLADVGLVEEAVEERANVGDVVVGGYHDARDAGARRVGGGYGRLVGRRPLLGFHVLAHGPPVESGA